ncbi:hypothetical protein D8B26_005373 [Coccidioides posadasii str. Silveira]|uniref:uncharacterized protein n=1 Tax=Coccidioides posadasii (strain RMSCC 757 / Silveira) TaxID=443226 RepID=UPI001BEE87FD|nr:hypothetical protein D8B26_005373 [Coccidioides posadasii str. Silveira]
MPKYDGTLCKRMYPPPGGDDPLEWLLQNTISDCHDFGIQHSKKQLGNRESLALLDSQEENMEKVLHELSDIRGRIETLQKQNTTLEEKSAMLEEQNTALEKKTAALQDKVRSTLDCIKSNY